MNTHRVMAAVLISLSLAFLGYAIGQGLERFRMDDRSITVKGLAELEVPSDFVIWTLSFRRANQSFENAQKALAADRDQVLAFLKKQGFADDEIEVRPLQVEDVLAREYAGTQQAMRYTGMGRVLVKTKRVDIVAKAALAVDPLVQAGLVLEGASGPQYVLRGVNALKSTLLSQATQNAKEQAENFAQQAGAKLGPLRRANQGLIQVTGDDGQEGESGNSRIKRLRVVSTFEYELRS